MQPYLEQHARLVSFGDAVSAPVAESDLDFRHDRNATLRLIDWFEIDRVRAARVLVVGAGAIGNEVLKNLALLGVGHVFIFDMDTIEMSNLSRSVLYRAEDHGHGKAETAARAVKALNENVEVVWCHGDIRETLGEGYIRRMDVVIGCLDSVDARFLLNRLCWRAGRPWVDAGIGPMAGQVRVFTPSAGPCYECSFSDETYRRLNIRQPCGVVGAEQAKLGRMPTTPTMASIVGGVQVQEMLKLLTPERWAGRTLAGKELRYDGSVGYVDVTGLAARADCPAHDTPGEDEIVSLPEMTAEHSARIVLAHARRLLGPSAHLYLSAEIALGLKCKDCSSTQPILRAVHRLARPDLTCLKCGHVCKWESDLSLTHVVNETSPEALLDTRISRLGVPQAGFVEARGADGSTLCLELAGDLPPLLKSGS